MTWRRHVHRQIAALADDALSPSERSRVEAHLHVCETCRAALDRHLAVAAMLRDVSTAEAPEEVWASIDAVLDRTDRPRATARSFPLRAWPAVGVAAVLLVGTIGFWWLAMRPAPWDVVRVDQTLASKMSHGQWLETDATSTAAVRVGRIGRVDLSPGTRLQLVSAQPNEHRLNLQRGHISVEIVAPPRVFFVETPASTVVDLGCAYTMDVDDNGSGYLRVTNGWAALEWKGLESLVPAGASARSHGTLGPGTPSFDDASATLRRALDEFDFGTARESSLTTVLSEARPRDTLTLWHLMWRVRREDRARVFDRMVQLTPLPDGVLREQALALDSGTMRRWREELAWTW